ncbi:MAG: hypothetical protein KKD01_19520 [Proteobacteria bacterium]|nr:hypothetical protein [Pseudomonadota bacterium]
MKKKWLIPTIGIILTIVFAYLALTLTNDRLSNLFSDFAGWSIGITGIATALVYLGRKIVR